MLDACRDRARRSLRERRHRRARPSSTSGCSPGTGCSRSTGGRSRCGRRSSRTCAPAVASSTSCAGGAASRSTSARFALEHERGMSEHGQGYDRYVRRPAQLGAVAARPERAQPASPSLYAAREAFRAHRRGRRADAVLDRAPVSGTPQRSSRSAARSRSSRSRAPPRGEGALNYLTVMAFISINLGLDQPAADPAARRRAPVVLLVSRRWCGGRSASRVREYAHIAGLLDAAGDHGSRVQERHRTPVAADRGRADRRVAVMREPSKRDAGARRTGPQRQAGAGVRSPRALAIRVLERVAERGRLCQSRARRRARAPLCRARSRATPRSRPRSCTARCARCPSSTPASAPPAAPEPAARRLAARSALRSGCYQLALPRARAGARGGGRDRRVVRAERGPALAGVANAVLRKLAAASAGAAASERRAGAAALARPGAARERWREARARDACSACGRLPPPLSLARVRRRGPRGAGRCLARRAPGGRGRIRRGSRRRALLVRRAGDPRALPGYVEGRFSVQEEGAQLVALCLGARPGERVADLCAGHGGKTAVLARGGGRRRARSPRSISTSASSANIPRELARLQPERAQASTLRAIDLRVGAGGLAAAFDRVLVDAPCTGLGTLRRRPELLLRVTEADPGRLAGEQLAILRQAARLVRPGGILLYAVCSPLPEEGANVVRCFESEVPGFARCSGAGRVRPVRAARRRRRRPAIGPLAGWPGCRFARRVPARALACARRSTLRQPARQGLRLTGVRCPRTFRRAKFYTGRSAVW